LICSDEDDGNECDTKNHGNHLSEKPENVRDFDSFQENVRHFTGSRGSVKENHVKEKWP